MRFALALIALVLAILSSPSRAADVAAVQGQSSTVSGQSAASIASGAVSVVSNGSAELPYKVQETTGTQTLKTTGAAMAPGIYNSSGQYTCFGGTSAAAGGVGWAIGGGTTKEMDNCLTLHRMDKAAGRAGAAIKASRDVTLPSDERAAYAEQARKFSRLWDAEYCALAGGSDAFKRAGLECPEAPQAASMPASVRQQPAPWQAGG